jgi:molecular chaperone DnaK (HSP70)
METLGGLFNVIIPRNTSVPTRFDHVFTTGVDNQTMVEIKVYQGERPLANVSWDECPTIWLLHMLACLSSLCHAQAFWHD